MCAINDDKTDMVAKFMNIWQTKIVEMTTCSQPQESEPITLEKLKENIRAIQQTTNTFPECPKIGDTFWLKGEEMMIVSISSDTFSYTSTRFINAEMKYD
jgi:hypothetical protein